MRGAELRVIYCLRDQSYSVGELAYAIDKSQSWTSEVVGDLKNDHSVDEPTASNWPPRTKHHSGNSAEAHRL